jgi:hypothetical protein
MIADYLLYGLRLATDLPVGAAREAVAGVPELTVLRGGDLAAGYVPPTGEVWAEADFGNGYGVRLARCDAGWSLFYPQTGEFRIAADLSTGTAHALPGRSEMLPLLLAGSVLSWVLNLRGAPVLHASAVERHGQGLAFIGASGMGKTTLATLLCGAGARLITDDVLHLAREGEEFLCHHGTGELRLRAGAAGLAEAFSDVPTDRSADGRVTLQPAATRGALPKLCGLVIPRPSRELTALAVTRLSGVEASFFLNGSARVFGWRQDEPLRRQFAFFAQIAGRVPVFRLGVPWGPPFPPGLAEEIFTACRLPGAPPSASA